MLEEGAWRTSCRQSGAAFPPTGTGVKTPRLSTRFQAANVALHETCSSSPAGNCSRSWVVTEPA